MRKIIGIAVVLVLVAVTICLLLRQKPRPEGFDRTQNTLLPETKRVLEKADHFFLLSIDPTDPIERPKSDPPPKETFHEYAVLGRTEIRDSKERAKLLSVLYKGIADSDGAVAGCFNPRHGISAKKGDETVDLLICFQCLSIQIFAKDRGWVLTTRSPKTTFNTALERAGLPVAQEK